MKLVTNILICGTLAAAAWPIGGNYPHARTALIVVGILLVLLSLWATATRRAAEYRFLIRVPFAWWLVVGGLVFVAFQGSSLSEPLKSTRHALWPAAQQIDSPRRAIGDDGKPLEQTEFELAEESRSSLSVYPAATRQRLCELFMGAAFFFAASCLLLDRRSIHAAMVTLAVTGVAISLFGIIQKLAWEGRIYWSYELLYGGVPFGPFVNKNNAGGFLIACLSGGVFLIAHQVFSWNTSGLGPGSSDGDERVSILKRLVGLLAGLQTSHLYNMAAVAFIVAGIFASLSRGASVSLVLAGILVMGLIGAVNRWAVALLMLIALTAGGITVWSEQATEVSTQIETLADPTNAAEPRFVHWGNVIPYLQDQGLWGSGLGTYGVVYPQFQTSGTIETWFKHAENVYIETLAELGIVGLGLLLLLMLSIARDSWRLYGSSDAQSRALGVAGLFCLVGVGSASLLDFGIYQPANLVVVATIFGMVVGANSSSRRRVSGQTGAAPDVQSKFTPVLVGGLMLLIIGAGLAWSVRESHAVESLRHGRRLLELFARGDGQDAAQLDRAEQLLSTAVAIRPDDSEAHYQMAYSHVARYRQAAARELYEAGAAELSQPESGGATATDTNSNDSSAGAPVGASGNPEAVQPELLSPEEAWRVTALSVLNRMGHISLRSDLAAFEDVQRADYFVHLQNAWDSFNRAEQACSLLPKTQFELARLAVFFVPADQIASRQDKFLNSALSRWPINSRLAYQCGLVFLQAGEPEAAASLWRRSLTLSRRYEPQIVQYARYELTSKQFLEDVLIQDPEYLLRIAQRFFSGPEQALPQRVVLVHTGRLVAASNLKASKKNFLMGQVNQLSENYPAAAHFYRKAVDLNPTDIGWRFQLARCLYEIKDYNGAMAELKICQLERSEFSSAIVRLIKRIERERLRDIRQGFEKVQ